MRPDERDPLAGERRPYTGAGLCPSCAHVRVVTSGKGSTFLLCGLAKTDARFPKYPPQPRMECPGHKP